jgi:AraC family transcriptional regulator, transcriptional activator of pobA
MKSKEIPIYSITDNKDIFLNVSSQSSEYIIAEVSSNNKLAEQPYRNQFFAIGICTEGSMFLKANLFEMKIEANTLIALNNATIMSWQYKTEYKGLIAFFNQSFITTQTNQLLFEEQFPFFQSTSKPIISLDATQAEKIKQLLNEMLDIQKSSFKGKDAMILNYIHILLNFANNFFEVDKNINIMPSSTASHITNQFKILVSQNFRDKRKVNDYANILCISPKHLSETIKNETGKTVTEFINNMVILEAKVLLKQTNLTVSQITEKLNFSDTSFFSKFFKKQTHCTPLEFRKIV